MSEISALSTDQIAVDYDVPVVMADGEVLRADVFRPREDGRYPVILSMGVYGKGLSFAEGYASQWQRMVDACPEILRATTGRYQNWEVVDPERWVPNGYVCVRVDSRGAGRSTGVLEPFSPTEVRDLYQCVEWAAEQDWSTGRVGLLGVSYYAMNQWRVAALQPPHLVAICVWEGAADFYREVARHGGILSEYIASWFHRTVTRVQHGVGSRGAKNPVTGEWVAGPETLPEEELAARRVNPAAEFLTREFDDLWYRERSAEFDKVIVPLLSCGNWGGYGMHLRGNTEGYLLAMSEQKWLEMHIGTHFTPFYRDRGVELQRKFFGYFLKGQDTGWTEQPKVQLQVRHVDGGFVTRGEDAWPLECTQWTRYYLEPSAQELQCQEPSSEARLPFDATGSGVTFRSPPLTQPLEITGPVTAKLYVASDTTDADVFVILRVFDENGDEVLFEGAHDPRAPVAMGWLRASHRKVDVAKSLPFRPYHSHDESWPLEPGVPVELDVEVWPTCIVVPAGYRIGVTISGADYQHDVTDVPGAKYTMRGTGPHIHTDERDRPAERFGGTNTLHFALGRQPYLLLPVIP